MGITFECLFFYESFVFYNLTYERRNMAMICFYIEYIGLHVQLIVVFGP